MLSKELIKKIRRIELRAKFSSQESLMGAYQSSLKGSGMEFEEVREYNHGDDVRAIDWNVTARSGVPHVKKFKEERELTLFLMVDISASGIFGTRGSLKRDHAGEISAILSYLAVKNNDKIGLILFSDTIERFLPPGKGNAHVHAIIRAILTHEPRNKGTNLGQALAFLGRISSRRSFVFLVSDFIDSGYEKILKTIAKKHQIVAIHVKDPLEQSLKNAGIVYCEDLENNFRLAINMSSKQTQNAFGNFISQNTAMQQKTLKKANVPQIVVFTDESFIDKLLKFFFSLAKQPIHFAILIGFLLNGTCFFAGMAQVAPQTTAPQEEDIVDIKPIFEESMPYLNLGLAIFGLFVLLLLLYLILKRIDLKKNRNSTQKNVPSKSAHEIAFEKLENLKIPSILAPEVSESLKISSQYYFELSFICREYLESALKLNVTDLTTEEFFQIIENENSKSAELINGHLEVLKVIFRHADQHKFALFPATEKELQTDKEKVKKLIQELHARLASITAKLETQKV